MNHARVLVATMTIATSVSGAFLGGYQFSVAPWPTMVMILGSGLLLSAGFAVLRSRAPVEGLGDEVEELRHIGQSIVSYARSGGLLLLISGLVTCSLSPVREWTVTIVAVGVYFLVALIHVFGRLYPSFDPPAPEPWVESGPAAETPVPDPDPGMARLLQRKRQLQSRDYR